MPFAAIPIGRTFRYALVRHDGAAAAVQAYLDSPTARLASMPAAIASTRKRIELPGE